VTLRLLTYNIRLGGERRVRPIAEVINSCAPDLVVLQEATRPLVVEQLADATGMIEWRSFNRQSIAFMSRGPVAHASWHRPRFSRHAFIEVVPEAADVRVFGLHLSAVHAAWTERRRLFELQALLARIGEHRNSFHVLTGDFNTLAPGEPLDVARLPFRLRPFVWLSGGRIKWRTVQTVLDAGYVDAYRRQHPQHAGHTFPTWDPHIRLDYVFAPSEFADRVISCEVVNHRVGVAASDHLPVIAVLEVA
jgi:endonuclease/exonuclease/phosphatase family metal-dependent hydrolase